MNLFWLDSPTVIILGLVSDFIGGLLLASDMIGLLEILERWNLKLIEKINSMEPETLNKDINIYTIIIVLKKTFGLEVSFKDILYLTWLFFLSYISGLILYILRLFNKIPTKKGIGLTGVIFLCLGFVFQIIGNL